MIDAPGVVALVERRAAETPGAPFLIDTAGRRLGFADYAAAVERAAAGIAARWGVREGTLVSWQLPTWIESAVLVGALSRLGAIQNPILPLYRHRELGFIVSQARPALLVVPAAWRGVDYAAMATEVVAEHAPSRGEGTGTQVVVVDRDLPEDDPATLPPPPAPAPAAGAPVRWIFYTSGTTADPKGALHTDATLLAAARVNAEAVELRADDSTPMVFPFTHVGGVTVMLTALMSGSRLYAVEAFDPAAVADLIAREGITLGAAGTPFHMAYLAEHRRRPEANLFRSVRAFTGGGSPKPPELHHALVRETGAGIVSGYGLTECPILAMSSIHDPDEKRARTEGRPARGVEVRIVTAEGRHAAPGEEGEIRVKGPMLFRGYLDPSLDADAFDEEGFFCTGDLGALDGDGYLVITGRAKDVIIRKGENVSAKELEDLLHTHPKVADVAVIGLPDPRSGERVCAVVAPADPAHPLRFVEMVEFLAGQGIMTQKIPEQLEIVDELPRNPTGKVLKHHLRARFASPDAQTS